MVAFVAAPILLAGSTATLGKASGGTASATTFDQTLVCATTFEGGARSISARAHRGTGKRASQWDRPAFASVTTGQVASQFLLLENQLAWVTAGGYLPQSVVVPATFAGVDYPIRTWGTIAWNARLCRTRSKPIPVAASGLNGGLAGVFDEEVDCLVPRRIVLRLRATLAGSAKTTRYRQFVRLTSPASEATIVARTEAGRGVAYASVSRSGKARLLTASGCVPD
jgi:hypothetical protein